MKPLIAGCVAFVALAASGAALAADIQPRPAVTDWSGSYFGLLIGVTTGESKHTSAAGDITPTFDLNGGLFGAALGYNWQMTPVVFGIDTDISLSTKHGSSAYLNGLPGYLAETSERWLGTYRGRVALMRKNWMFYVTGGAASAYTKITATEPLPTAGIGWENKLLWGWTAGAGMEAAGLFSFRIKFEYLYADFGNQDFFNPPPAGFINRAGGVRLYDHILRIGLNHRFE